MATSEKFSQILNPLLLCLKKMELELTCPNCSNLLSVPMLLPCNHIFCSRCIITGDNSQYDCLVCPSSFAREDLRHSIHIQALVDLFKSMDDAITAFQKLDSQIDISGDNDTAKKSQLCLVTTSGLEVPSKEIPLSDSNGADMEFQGSQFGLKVPQKESHVSSTNSTKESLQEEELASKEHGGKSINHVYTRRPRDSRRSSEHATFGSKNHAEKAGKETFLNQGEQEIHPCGYTKDSETNYSHQGDGLSNKRLSIDLLQNKDREVETKGKREAVLISCIDTLTCERQLSEKSDHSSCRASSQLDADNVRESKRQKLLHISCKLPKLKTEEEKIKDNTSPSLIDHSTSLGNSLLEQRLPDLWTTAFGICNEWRLCGSDLSTSQEGLLDEFARLTGASVTRMWKKDATHVIVSTDEHSTCSITKKVLMAILSGQWVLKIDWVKACMEAKQPVPEEPHEIFQISLQARVGVGSNGPKKGRLRIMKKAPKIFSGLSFYFGNQFKTFERCSLEELVIAAGGTVLKEHDLKSRGSTQKVFSSGPSYIVYNEDRPQTCNLLDLLEIGSKRCDEIAALAAETGFMVIGHLWILDAIATCNSADELAKGVI